jgi:hypothetical protein
MSAPQTPAYLRDILGEIGEFRSSVHGVRDVRLCEDSSRKRLSARCER